MLVTAYLTIIYILETRDPFRAGGRTGLYIPRMRFPSPAKNASCAVW
jgi:hypothetical protein